MTIKYYDTNADGFASRTSELSMGELYVPFLHRLPAKARILDYGCGAGRDSAAFKALGHEIHAVDGSEEMCRIASERLDMPVEQMMFEELTADSEYDGIWACASLLHLPREQLKDVLQIMAKALVPDGVAYISFKYGSEEGYRNGRWFTDLTESDLWDVLRNAGEPLRVEEQWQTRDVRPDRSEVWLNAILRKPPASISCADEAGQHVLQS